MGKNYDIIRAVNTEARVDLTKFTLSLISRQLRKGWSLALKSSKGIVSLVAPIADRVAAQLGYFVWDIDYVKEGTEWFLRIDIDKEGGVGIEDCERFHTAIDLPLDELNPTNDKPYILNVSSPGIDRPIKTDKEFERNLEEVIEVRLFQAINKKKLYVGSLVSFTETTITLETDKGEVTLERNLISKATKYIDF